MKQIRVAADHTRKAILKAAEKYFSKSGFSGASISEIAKTAKINKSLIYHHFENKEGLWGQVKLNIYLRYYKAFDPIALAQTKSLPEFISEFIHNRIAFLQKNPTVLRILQWQRLEPKAQLLQLHNTEYLDQWLEAFAILQQRGEMDPEIEKDMALLWLFSSLMGVFEEASMVFRKDKEAKQQQYVNFIIESLTAALKKSG